jgi:hypothetical protein
MTVEVVDVGVRTVSDIVTYVLYNANVIPHDGGNFLQVLLGPSDGTDACVGGIIGVGGGGNLQCRSLDESDGWKNSGL